VSHLVDAYSHGKNKDILLLGVDRHAVGIAQAKPLLGYFNHFVSSLADCDDNLTHLVTVPIASWTSQAAVIIPLITALLSSIATYKLISSFSFLLDYELRYSEPSSIQRLSDRAQ